MVITDRCGCHHMKYFIEGTYTSGEGNEYIRFFYDHVLTVAKIAGVDDTVGQCAHFSVLFEFGRDYADNVAAVCFYCLRYTFHKSETGTAIYKSFSCFSHPFAYPAGHIEIHFVNVSRCRTEYSYLFHTRCRCYSLQISAIFYKRQ